MRRGTTKSNCSILQESYSVFINDWPFLTAYTTERSAARALIRELRHRRIFSREKPQKVDGTIKVKAGETAQLIQIAEYHLMEDGSIWRASDSGRIQTIEHTFEREK